MLTNTLTEDELVSKKVKSMHHLEVVRFCASQHGAPINFTNLFAPRFTACSKRVCRWNTVTCQHVRASRQQTGTWTLLQKPFILKDFA
ncbi:hypothetical protein LDENG_00075680 [Lucifuga dentata]|nr:hypothetical protein LDENG_00075680 [Lucifuga dentata]